jgi:hypothetical protein
METIGAPTNTRVSGLHIPRVGAVSLLWLGRRYMIETTESLLDNGTTGADDDQGGAGVIPNPHGSTWQPVKLVPLAGN